MNSQDTQYKKYQKLVAGKNINPQTLLATDYLNHFNEIHMLIDMIAEMPDCLEDVLNWRILSYQEHFRQSVFQDKELAIEAYNFSPDRYKMPFEKCVNNMNKLLTDTISQAESAIISDDIDAVHILVENYSPRMEKLIEKCSGIINSKEITSQQNVIDDYFEDDHDHNDTSAIDQNAVDDLFD